MLVSIIPSLIERLLRTAEDNLTEIAVHDGIPVTDQPDIRALYIAVEDPDTPGLEWATDASQDWATSGRDATREEAGDITCAAIAWNGNTGPDATRQAREEAYEIVAKFGTVLRADPTLDGLPGLLWVSLGTRFRHGAVQGTQGAECHLIFTIHFEAYLGAVTT